MLMTIKYEITKFNHKIGSKAVNETIICDPSKLFVQDLFCYVFSKMRHQCASLSQRPPDAYFCTQQLRLSKQNVWSAQHLFSQQRKNTHHILS